MIDHSPQDGAPKIAFSWFITPITMIYGTYNYSYWDYKPTYNLGGPTLHGSSAGAGADLDGTWFHGPCHRADGPQRRFCAVAISEM